MPVPFFEVSPFSTFLPLVFGPLKSHSTWIRCHNSQLEHVVFFFSPGICWRFLEFCHEDVPGARNHQVALGIQLVKKRAPKRCLGYIPGDEILPRTKNGGFFKQPKLAPLLVQLRELNLESNCWWFRNLVFTTRDPKNPVNNGISIISTGFLARRISEPSTLGVDPPQKKTAKMMSKTMSSGVDVWGLGRVWFCVLADLFCHLAVIF